MYARGIMRRCASGTVTSVASSRRPSSERHWAALRRMLSVYERPAPALVRYLSNGGRYPWTPAVRTPTGRLTPRLRDYHDLLTLNEIFCRGDYGDGADARVVVDIGANRGLAALFFLSRRPDSRVYCFEPDPANTAVLRDTLAGLEDRYVLVERAVTATDVDSIRFVPGGRYGRTAVDEDEPAVVLPAIGITAALEQVLEREHRIDLVKIDTEGTEAALVAALQASSCAASVGRVVYEDDQGMTRWVT